uniref:G-protein coupled receptors family 2 profile 1 domain-containing protein n=1 Tax=Oncorhynchus tshawytscha TaxID=74940 RepID=A0AAZ3RDU1_ONCTS
MPMLRPAWHRGGWAQGSTTVSPLLILLLSSLQDPPLADAMKLTLKELISKRNEYRENCTRILAESYFSGTGTYCNGTVDLFVCWPHSAPGNVSVPCPSYLPWVTEGDVYRQCLSNGSWRLQENSSEAWRDQRECDEKRNLWKMPCNRIVKHKSR